MKRFVGFLSLMVLLLNSVLMPLTYAQEYQDEILGAQVNNTVGDSSNVENVSETEGEQNEGADDASQFPVIEENPQEPEITPVDESQDEEQEIPSESTLSGGLEGSGNTNQEGANGVGSGNDLDETLGSGAEENLNVQTGADQVDDVLSGAQVTDQSNSSGNSVNDNTDEDEETGFLSSIANSLDDFLGFSSLISNDSNEGDMKLFSEESFTVTFDANRGAFADTPASQIVTSGGVAEEPQNHPKLNGYTFTGWYTEAKGGVKWNFDTDVVTGNITLYAHWDYNFQFGDLDVYIIDGNGNLFKYVLMDRNVGASDIYNQNFDNQNFNSFGYVYQWGNNWGFNRCSGAGATCHGTNTVNPSTNSSKVQKSVWELYVPSKYTRDVWVTSYPWNDGHSNTNNLWGFTSNNLEDKQGPCPDGYYVPTNGEFRNNNDSLYKKWKEVYGYTDNAFRNVKQIVFTEQFLLPLAGHHKKGQLTDLDKGQCADYWTSEGTNGTNSSNVWFCKDGDANYKGTLDLVGTSPTYNGSTVRCFKDSSTASFTIDPDKGKGAIITIDKLNGTNTIIALTDPSRTQDGLGDLHFDGWYTDPDFDPSTKKEARDPDNPQADSTVYTLSANETALYAKWSCPQEGYEYNGISCAQRHTITFDATGGTIDVGGVPQTTTTESLLYGVTYDYSDLPIPTRPGYIFKGWYAEFNGVDDYVDYGRDYMFTDQISFHASAYMNIWNTGKRIVSSMHDGGWAFDGGADGIFRVSAYKGNASTSVVRAESNMGWADLSSGWHDFDFVFDGNQLKLYLDGNLAAESPSGSFPNGKIVYNPNNTMLVGAAASLDPTNPEGYYFEGKIKDVIFKNSDQRITSTEALSVPNKDVTYYADWEPINTTYDVDVEITPLVGGTVTGTGTYSGGDSITLEAIPNIGYQFSGWYDDGDNLVTTDNPYVFTADSSAGTGLKAVFEIASYSVIWRDYNGTQLSGATYHYNEPLVVLDGPTRAADNTYTYTFAGWSPSISPNVTESKVYTATYHPTYINYTITFVDWNGTQISTALYYYGETILLPSDPSRGATDQTGYTFNGWYDENNNKITGTPTVDGNKTYRAVYDETLRKYSITWNYKDGNGGNQSQTISVDYGTIPSHASGANYQTDATGYTFAGWTPTPYAVTGDQTYTAIYDETLRDYTITWKFMDANGVEQTENTTGYYGEMPSHASGVNYETPQTGYTFIGWTPSIHSITGEETYRAVYDETLRKYTVNYDYQSHSGSDANISEEKDYGEIISLPMSGITPQKEGYEFMGWTTTLGGTGSIGSTYEVKGNVTLYPIFKKEAINKDVTFYKNGSAGYNFGGVTYYVDKAFSGCVISASYNNEVPGTGCSIDLILPGIIASENTPVVSGWTLRADGGTKYNTGAHLSLFVEENDVVNFYAQTYASEKLYIVNYSYGTGVVSKDVTTGGCVITGSVNGIAQSGSCEVTLPVIEEVQGYENGYWYKKGTQEYYLDKIELSEANNGIELEAIAKAKGGIQYVIKHYFQMLNDDLTGSTNRYEMVYTYTGAGTGDTQIDLSEEKLGIIPEGFYYWKGKINNVDISGDIVDLSSYTDEDYDEETTINPDGSLVIKLFYKRELYTGVWKNGDDVVRTAYNLPYGILVNNYRPSDPSREATDQTGYVFNGWYDENDYELTGTTVLRDNTTYTARYDEVLRDYTITWKFMDANGVEQTETTTGYYGTMPSHASGANYQTDATGYTFAGWTPDVHSITGDETYTAVYNEVLRSYSITWNYKDGNGAEQTETITGYYGTIPSHVSGANYQTTQTGYTFIGWSPVPYAVTGDETYTAIYDETLRDYTITWKFMDANGVEQTETITGYYGTMLSHASGVNYQTTQTGYTFAGWTPEVHSIIGEETYTAIYDETLRDYQITWKYKNTYGIEEIENTTGYYGTMPSHDDGVNYQTAQTGYIFVGWSPAIHSITGAETYMAIYDEILRDYTITWKFMDANGVEQTETITGYYGTMPSHASGANYQTTQTGYTFAGWTPEVHSIIGEETYRAVYDEELRSYTITFHSNGGSSVDAQTKAYGTVGDKPENPTRDGYDFDGWYSNSGLTIEYHFTEVIEGNVDLYAKWSPITYTITYEYNNGTGSNPETYQIITPEFTLSNPTRIGYTFIGWSGTSLVGSGNKTVTISVGSTGNRAYEANWKANKYQVTYKANGGEGEDVKDEATYDEHYEFLSNSFVRTGYSFVEWNTKADGSGSGFVEGFSGIWKTTTGVNLYAIWNENSYNVAYLGGEGAIGSKAGFTTGYTNTFVLADNEGSFIKTGYTFSGWTYDGKHYAAGTELSRLASENGVTVTFTAEWNVVSYTITYEYNNGTGSNPETYQVDTPSFTLNNPTRKGYTFIGWSGTELEGSDNTNVTIVIGSVGDREYEANWEANKYNVTYKANGGEGADVVEEATYDAKYVFTGNKFTRIGYEFVEWNTKADGTGTGYAEGFSGIWKTATGVNLFAQWIAETYTVTFDGNEGEVTGITDKDVIFDSAYGDLSTASRTGYTFTGWYTEAVAGEKVESDTIVATASNHTLYAHWDENSYNVVYEGGIGSEGVVTGATYRYTESFNLAANNFTKRGYSFSGWKNGDNHYAAGAELSRLATQNGATVTFTAEWNVVPYSITYKLNGGIFSGVVNPTTYTIESDKITVKNPERVGYIFLGWTGTDLSALTTKVVITGGSIGDRTYYANWQARDDIKITINHYLQDLAANNTVLDTYSISGTTEEEGTADSIVDISDYQQSIAGYSYGSGKVDGSVVSTTTVSPDGSRVIDLFYTRNSYSYTIITLEGSSTEGSSLDGNYYYGAKVILSGDSNNDCFVWSGWDIQGATLENNMKQTSFNMPANEVTVTSLVTEKTYNIVFNGNGNDSGTMLPLNGIKCRQEFALPFNSFVKTGHTFTGWTTTPNGEKEFGNGAVIKKLTTGENVTIELIAIWDKNRYPVVWKDYNGSVLYEEEVLYEATPVYHGVDPSRDADEQYTYTFAGWSPGEHPVTGAQVYTAVYNQIVNTYTVTWNVNGEEFMETYEYGGTPNFTGSKHKDPDEQYTYTFAGWSPEVQSVSGDITYTATYTSTLRKYPIVWLNYDGSELRSGMVQYGDTPEYGGATPTRPSEPEHTYEFIGWSDGINDYDVNDELPAVEGEATYFARFSGTQNEYTIIWLNYNNHLLEMDTGVVYGSIPSYDGETPTKESDAQYDYEFSGWSPATGTVVKDQTYIATYTSIPRTYTVTWKNSDGSTIKQQTGILYGTVVEYVGDVPTSGSSAEYDYEFISWNPTPGEIERDTTYTAMYKTNKRKYLIRFVNGETELQSGMVEYGVTPVYTGDEPTKSGDAQYSYHYVGWNPGISAVTGNMTYEAKFNSTVNKYSVTFVNYDGVSVVKPASEYDYGTSWEDVVKPEDDPTKPQDAQYTYEFSGWIPVVTEITGDVIFKAVYSGITRTYTVTWKNDDGTVLETDNNVPYGTTPAYNGSTPIKPETSQHKYVFIGWEPVISDVSGDITYIAQFAEASQVYTITWVDEDGTELEVDTGVIYGSIPSYDGETPTKESDAQYDYVFAGWSPATGIVVGDQTYSATYTSVLRTYTVTWKNGAIVLKTDYNVPHGSTPVYNGSTPVRTGNAQYSYSFDKWAPDVGPISSDTTYNATFDEIINKYVVTWDNYDGTELSSEEVEYGTLPTYTGSTPTKPKTAQYTYIFSNSWLPAVTAVTTGATYTAQFTSTVNEYTITWKDGDGNTLKTEQVAYDETPEYIGATPTKTADAQYTYSFNNTWSPVIESVTGDMTYTAQFDSTVNKYTITWIDGDDQVLKTDQVEYGETPEYTGETPTKTPTQEHTYTFKGWSPAVTSVTGPATYKAVFDGDVNEYAITWLDGDGNILKMETLEYGQMPSYSGATPTKTATAQYSYTFNNTWSPAIVSVTTGATYTAQFSSTVNEYTITWKDGDGNTLKTEQVAYGQTPTYVGATPTKTATAQYSYTFNNTWSPAIVSVSKNATYTAQFDSDVNEYTIIWKDGDGNTIKTDQVAYGQTPTYVGNTPTKTATAQYSYTFAGWDPEIKTVTTGATYTAQFDSTVNKYAIVWKDWDGIILKPAEDLEYGVHPEYGLEPPTREGDAQYSYTFNGWNPAVQDVTGPQVYTATYLQTVNKYRIIFLNDDDSEITSKQVEYGTTVTNYKPADPVKEGYTFNGWNPNLVTVVTGATYKATYTINQYTLTPELGVGLERIEGGGTFDYGTEVIFTGYAKEGYHFEGGETVKVFTVTVRANNAMVRINAIANKYVVRFQPNEGDGTMQDQEFAYDLTGILHANSFRRSGYTFTGWIDEFGNYYADQGKVYNLATGGVVEFTALWKVGEDKPVEPTPAAGGGRIIPKEDKDQEHGSADTQTGGTGAIDSGSQYTTGDVIPGDGSWTQEEMDAYKYAYKYHITTLAPREAAMPDDYVIRGHMAKMVVNYAVNVLGWKLPEKLPKQCKWKDGANDWESQEIKDYAEKACALGLMGIDMNYFQPNKYVTRAQFGTIFGRLLRGKLPSTPYYAAHLAGLKERGIMTQIDHPEDRIEIRKWAWLMFMRSEKYFNIKK